MRKPTTIAGQTIEELIADAETAAWDAALATLDAIREGRCERGPEGRASLYQPARGPVFNAYSRQDKARRDVINRRFAVVFPRPKAAARVLVAQVSACEAYAAVLRQAGIEPRVETWTAPAPSTGRPVKKASGAEHTRKPHRS